MQAPPGDHSLQVPESLHPDISKVLQDYAMVFQTPTGLPPSRAQDHAIPLQEGAQPIKTRPYRYPHSQKAQIEKVVQEMLEKVLFNLAIALFLPQFCWLKRRTEAGDFVQTIGL